MKIKMNRLLGAGAATVFLVQPGLLLAQEASVAAPRGVQEEETRRDDSTSLFHGVAKDFARFFSSPETYLVLGIGLGTSASLGRLDERVVGSRLNGERSHWGALDATFEAGEYLGGSFVQLGGALAAYGVGRVVERPRLSALGRDLIRVQILNGVVTHALKRSVGRRRPDATSHRSFPSGHASSTFATAAVLNRHYGWSVGAPAFGIASYVAASRLSENRHYLSDVVFGAAVGIAAGRAVTFGVRSMTFELAPLAVSGGAGIRVDLVTF